MADVGALDLVWSLEQPLAIGSTVLAAFALYRYAPLGWNRLYARAANPGLGLVRLCVLAAGAWFWWVMATAADADVTGFYTWLYAALAYACLLWATFWRPILGLFQAGDVVERGNLAAALVLAGFVLGTAFAFGGALSGQDASCRGAAAASPLCQAIVEETGHAYGYGGWHVVLVFFLLAYFELRANLTMVDRIGGGLSRQVRVERDVPAGFLLGCVAVASGLVAGRAAAGDFTGWGPALADYGRRLWPLAIVPFAACLAGFLTNGRPRGGPVRVAAGAALVAGAGAWYAFT